MQVEIFDTTIRLGLLVAMGVGLLGSAGLAVAKKPRWSALFGCLATLCAATLLIEQLTTFLVQGAATGSVDFNEYRWVFLSPWGRPVLALSLGLAILTVLLTAISTRRIHSPWRWSAVVGLRSAAVATALILFLQPAVELRQVAREPNRIAIVVDQSSSMELSDDQGRRTRREHTRDVLDASTDVFESWGRAHLLDFYTFADGLASSSQAVIATTPSEGEKTLLRQALEEIRKRYQGDELAGVVLISDGVATGDLAEIGEGEFSDFARELDAPIHTVWAGKKGLKDVAVSELRADEFAFVRTVTRVEAIITTTGYERKRIPVTLSSDGKAMRRKWIEVGPGETSVSAVFEFTPSHVGKYVYKISVPVDEDEAVIENNSSWFVIRVIRDKIRVLLVTGQPSWDVRALRGMLKQNPNVDLISFFILRTPEDIKQASNDELSLIPFPTRELFQQELPSFDLVIMQNFNYGPYGIGRYLENIRSYVEGGGGLMMLGGALSFGSGHYSNTPIAKALPVELPHHLDKPDELLNVQRFQPRLTELGSIHPVTALRYETADNQSVWKSLPALEGVNMVLRAKKNAAVLAVHPTLHDKSNAAMPVIIAGDYGEGRSLAVTTDSLWRWDFIAAATPGNDGRHYLKLWDNAIRWLIQDPELRYLRVDSDKVSYSPNTSARLNFRLLDQDYSPLAQGTIQLRISRGFDPAKLEEITSEVLTADDTGEASFELEAVESGVYRVESSATVRGRKVTAKDIFLVHEAATEHMRPAANDSILRMLSQISEGDFLGHIDALPENLDFIAPKVVRVDKRSDVALWSQPWLLLCAFLFLGLEWVLRQRSGSL